MSHITYLLERNTIPDNLLTEESAELLMVDIAEAIYKSANGLSAYEAVEAVLPNDLFTEDRDEYLKRFDIVSQGIAHLEDYAKFITTKLKGHHNQLERVRVTPHHVELDILIVGNVDATALGQVSDIADGCPLWHSQTVPQYPIYRSF